MTSAFYADALRPQANNRDLPRPGRDVSISDFSWVTSPAIYGHSIPNFVPLTKGATNTNDRRTDENQPQFN
jgi:hypothetical protein